jgi:MFS family permease
LNRDQLMPQVLHTGVTREPALSYSNSSPSAVVALGPLMAVVLIAFVVMGMALPVLPLHVHDDLGFGAATVGLVAGSQFAASLLSRMWAGHTCDNQGPKRAIGIGIAAAALAGLIYLLSLRYIDTPRLSVVILLAGRAMLGGAESFIITGATVWGLARAGSRNAGTVIAWIGTAMFVAFAGGAPLGVALYNRGGFAAIAVATVLAPLATFAFIAPLQSVAAGRKACVGMLSVLRIVWLPGLGAALSSVGFGVIVSFGSLLFAQNGWTPVWLAFTSYAVALIVARMLFGHLPDRAGGAKVALIFVLIETAGLALIGLASSTIPAAIGAALVGFGYALVFPGLGVEAVRRAPPKSRGLAMGAYAACLDLALGITGPVLGFIAANAGLSIAFLVSAVIVLASAGVSAILLRQGGPMASYEVTCS